MKIKEYCMRLRVFFCQPPQKNKGDISERKREANLVTRSVSPTYSYK